MRQIKMYWFKEIWDYKNRIQNFERSHVF